MFWSTDFWWGLTQQGEFNVLYQKFLQKEMFLSKAFSTLRTLLYNIDFSGSGIVT